MEGNEKEEYTFIGGKGNTVIDYVMGNEEVRERIKKMEIGNEIDSDHQPVKVRIRGEGRKKGGAKKERKDGRGRWDEEEKRIFRRKLGKIELGKEDMEKEWEELERRLKLAIKETEKEQDKKEEGKGGWWDKECEKKKREVGGEMRKSRKGTGEEERYKKSKLEYKELCRRKKKEENDRWEKKAAGARREKEVWEIVNRERKKRRGIQGEIEIKEWKEYFIRIMGGVEVRVVKGNEGKGRGKGEEEEGISKGEIKEVIRNLKDGKVAGIDGITGEAWKYGGEEMEEWIWGYCNRIWKGEGWPEEWKE
ncbi:regulator of nonsense transcripts 3B-like [Linepithema humile]|uniref:regulator of nonsense transcripts 3B-like n=1 Tax=Linepithema humile TaxID=83485 RepID=UPI00351ED8CE